MKDSETNRLENRQTQRKIKKRIKEKSERSRWRAM